MLNTVDKAKKALDAVIRKSRVHQIELLLFAKAQKKSNQIFTDSNWVAFSDTSSDYH